MMTSGSNSKSVDSCRESFEKSLERMDSRLTDLDAFHKALGQFLLSDVRYDVFDSNAEYVPFHALYGVMTLRLPKLHKERLELIERIEAEQTETVPATLSFQIKLNNDDLWEVGFIHPNGVWRVITIFNSEQAAQESADDLNGVK